MQQIDQNPNLEKSALRGEPSYVWREGQQRRLEMIFEAFGGHAKGYILEAGCGVGMYISRLSQKGGQVFGMEYDWERTSQAGLEHQNLVNAAGENLPYMDNSFDAVLSHEVIEHVADDRESIREIIRVLKPGGRLALFCPNRGYPVETHGIFWRGKYHFGNIPLVNYLPLALRDKLAPHVRVYTRRDLRNLFDGLNVKFINKTILFGGYDNIITRMPALGKTIRSFLYLLERTPLRILGLSHFWVVEKL